MGLTWALVAWCCRPRATRNFLPVRSPKIAPQTFVDLLTAPCQSLADEPDRYAGFKQEMRRFLPAALVTDTVEKPAFWQFVTAAIHEECQRATHYLLAGGTVDQFKM